VNNLQANINSLIESFGLDANTAAVLRGENMHHTDDDIVTTVGQPSSTIPAGQYDNVMGDDTFDFDSFLLDPSMHQQTGFNAMQNGADRIGAFLDEVRSVSNDSEVTAQTPDSTIVGAADTQDGDSGGMVGVGAKKRKSDAVELVSDGRSPKALRTSKKR